MRQLVKAVCVLWLAGVSAAAAQDASKEAASAPYGDARGLDAPLVLADTAPDPASPVPVAADLAGPVIVELYTAQGCSACPPADALMAQLVQDPRLLPLSLHVDYWDYLGWRDAFGQAAFTARQKSYAKAAGERMIYTPQMVIAGVERVVATRAEEVAQAIDRRAAMPRTVRLTVDRQGDRIVIKAESVPPSNTALRIDLVRYDPQHEVAIERGENAGRIVTYYNVVTTWDHIADWTATTPIEVEAQAPGPGPGVVLVQGHGPGEIMAAALLK